MQDLTPSKAAARLMNERSRDVLREEFGAVLAAMGADEGAAFFADMWLTLGASHDHVKERLAHLLASRFGKSSEKATPAQLVLFGKVLHILGDEPGEAGDAPDSEATSPKPADLIKQAAQILHDTDADIHARTEELREQHKRDREARREAARLEQAAGADPTPAWPDHLPVREVILPVEPAYSICGDCQVERAIIGYEKSWVLEHTSTTEVVVTMTPIVACASHHGGPLAAPAPPKPVDRGQLGFTLSARILWLRITHNLPVARIAEMMRAEQIPVTETMIHRLIEESGERAVPVVKAIQREVHQATLVNLDDTPVDVYEGTSERTRRRARVWLALGDDRFAYFFATRTWKTAEAEAALGPITGTLQGDGYKGFQGYAARHQVTLAGCMAHLRRKFQRALKAHDPRAELPLALVQGLYRVEKLARLRDLGPDQRLQLRQQRSEPLFLALVAWAREMEHHGIETGSPLGKAWTYLSNQLVPLQAFLLDGQITIDNNAAERGLRRITIGRKLWLFFRGQSKLEHVSRLMSIAYTARLQGVDELGYLTWVLEQLARREWTATTARALLPDAWLAMQQEPEELASA